MKLELKILLVEDNIIEILKLKRAIENLGMNHEVLEAENGEIALDSIKQEEINPDIVLLDLNMPKMNGLEFLAIVRNDESMRHLPIIILSTSNNNRDLMEAYKLGVSGYILKPLKYDDYVKKIEYTLQYWSNNELITHE
ncbi:MAG: response regulator [Polaribacter sp.]|jgi:CheY-like chemotaxis protein